MNHTQFTDLAEILHNMMFDQFNCDQIAAQGQYCYAGTHIFDAIDELLKRHITIEAEEA